MRTDILIVSQRNHYFCIRKEKHPNLHFLLLQDLCRGKQGALRSSEAGSLDRLGGGFKPLKGFEGEGRGGGGLKEEAIEVFERNLVVF